MKRRIVILILLAAVIAGGVYLYTRLTRKPEPANQITLSGNIEAHESLISFKVQGRVIDLPIEEGQAVKSGQLLARLDDADYRQKLRIDAANVHVRESNLALALAGTREQEIKAAQHAMLEAQADFQQKKLDNERAQRLFSRDAVSAQDRDLAETAMKRSGAAFQSASNAIARPWRAVGRKISQLLAPTCSKGVPILAYLASTLITRFCALHRRA